MTADATRWRPAPLALLRRTGFPFELLDRLTVPEVAGSLDAYRAARTHAEKLCAEFTAQLFDRAVREQEAAQAPPPVFKALYRVRRAADRTEPPPAHALATVESLGPETADWAARWRAATGRLDTCRAHVNATAEAALTRARTLLWQTATTEPFREAVLLSNPGAYERVLHRTPLTQTHPTSPVGSPVGSPVASPVGSPVASPVASPVGSPVTSPVASPASPASSASKDSLVPSAPVVPAASSAGLPPTPPPSPGPPGGRNAKVRREEGLLYAYLQRFCAKNESVSFFGPVDAVRVEAGSAVPLVLNRRAGSLQGRWTRAAHWAAEALAGRAAEDLAEHVPLRLAPGFAASPDGRRLVMPDGRAARLDPASGAAVRACDAGVTLGRFAEKATSEEEAAARRLMARGVIRRDIPVPTAVDDPLAALRAALAGMGEDAATWVARVDRFAAGVARFAAAGDADRLEALRAAEEVFAELSGAEPRRAAGTIYADRLIVTEDCRGDVVDAAIGGPLLDGISTRLDPVLRLCAGYGLTVADAVHERALALHAELGGGAATGFLPFIAALDAHVDMTRIADAPPVAAWLARLAALVRDRDRDGLADLDPADVAPFTRPLPPGLTVSPDIFLAAPDEKALRDGAAELIVGEIHHGTQVWTHLGALLRDHDHLAAEIAELLTVDGRLPAALVHRRTQGKAFERDLPGLDIEVLGRSTKDDAHRLRAADVTVVRGPDGLRLRHPGHGDLFLRPRDPRAASSWLFGPPPVVAPPLDIPGASPRVRLGGVTLWRRAWEIPAAALDGLLRAAGPAEALLAADRLRAEHGLPARVFARVPGERKPFYADLAEPLSLEHLVHMTRAASGPLRLTELLPGPDGWWLADGRGRYSTELRMTYFTRPQGPRGKEDQ
ncbi:hypothetical protein ABGB17_16525 [Sphaerisporangium sp. B11E5]|uniref:hypothetical protein n=1 Tax=Sphaerisporangium sp. B11E5 TaxID=3153563 RepID=UPI00325C969D